jgi:hypothetical protein
LYFGDNFAKIYFSLTVNILRKFYTYLPDSGKRISLYHLFNAVILQFLISHVGTVLDSQDRTVSIGFPGQDIEERVCRVKQIGLDNENMITNIRQRGKRDGDRNAGAGSLG